MMSPMHQGPHPMSHMGHPMAGGGPNPHMAGPGPSGGLTPQAQGPQQPQQQQLVPVQNPQQGQQVSLALLIEFIVQRTYHDLTVLAELLPRKTDMERKIEIFNYASRTRMILIRLLALVKWASSASKVDKCVSIMNFCERSANIFMETADNMAKMARETLVRATLPNFHLPAAVEILTTGSYNRVPRCIRDRIVPPEPITAVEKRQILLKLNQVIEHRLVTSDLPAQMRNLKIENGQVIFTVRHEFEATLTLMGEGPQVPWRLLGINILVEDKETGEGKSLMHSMQVRYLEQLIQSRLVDNPQPLHELYNILHTMCQSLQIEVLHSQTQKLCYERLGDYIRIEEVIPGKCLTISYWRELMSKDPNSELGYRFSVQVDPHDAAKPLLVCHVPTLPAKEAELAEQAIRTDHISMERLLVHSIYARTKSRLRDLKTEVQRRLNLGDVEATLHGSPAVLSIPILQPCLRSEQLLITVDTHTGIFLAHVPQYEDNPITQEIQQNLNEDKSKLESLVSQLRHWITKQRVHKTLQQLPASSYEQLPVLFDLHKHPLKDLSTNRMYIRIHRHPNAIIIIEFHEKATNHCEIEYKYYFLWVRPASIEDNPNDDTVVTDIPKVYLKALGMVEFDPFLVTHGPNTKVDVQDLSEKIIGKRKLGGKVEAPIKRTKFPAYFISDLAHVVAFTDERLPFTDLITELDKKGVAHSGIETEDKALGLVVKLLKYPAIPNVSKSTQKRFQKHVIETNIRLQHYIQPRSGRNWMMEVVFSDSPIRDGNASKSSKRKTFVKAIDISETDNAATAVDAIIDEWSKMIHLFDLLEELQDPMETDDITSGLVSVKSYQFQEATFEFGPGNQQLVKVSWNSNQSRFNLVFGGTGDLAGMCPHNVVKEQLETHLNQHRDLALLIKTMQETYLPLKALIQLPNIPQMSVVQQKVNHPVETFVILPQSPNHLKVIFYNTYCLDIQIKAGGLVFVRDGAISLFNQRKALEEVLPIQGLKSFLMKYVDENSLQRRQSQTEDDNPPSPMNIGGDESASVGPGLKSHHPHTPPSNPLTPASPHTSVPSSTGGNSGFLQSPPSMSLNNPSPSQVTASPSGFTAPSPANPTSSVGSPFPSVRSPFYTASPMNAPKSSPRPGGAFDSSRTNIRILPQRLWAGAHPTPLTVQAFEEICKPCPTPSPGLGYVTPNLVLAPLHRFLGNLFLRRQLQHMIRQEDWIQAIPVNESTTIAFKVEGMTCKVSCVAANAFQSLHAKLEPDPSMMNQWSPEMLQVLEKFFDTRVAVPPFRPNALSAFVRILQCPIDPIKDIINIMRLDIIPDLVVKNNLKWGCRICLTVPPAAPPIMPLGQPGLFRAKEKMLLFLQITRANVSLPAGQEPLSVVIPLVYDIHSNQTTVAQKEVNSVISIANQQLARLQRSGQLNMQRCTIYPSVQDLLYNLTLQNEGPPHQGPHGGNMMGGQQHFPPQNQMMGPGPQQQQMMGVGPMGPRGQVGPQRMMNPNMVMQQRQQMMNQPNQFMS